MKTKCKHGQPLKGHCIACGRGVTLWEKKMPQVVAVASPDVAAWLDPDGGLRKAGLMQVAT